MPVISRTELENAQRDVTDLGSIVNGAPDRPNPGKELGTVTTRLGQVVKTLARLVSDGAGAVAELLSPLTYETVLAMNADKTALKSGVLKIKAGQTCYCKETTQIYILTEGLDINNNVTRTWEQVSDLAQAASAGTEDLLLRKSAVGRVSVDDYEFLLKYDRFLEKDVHKSTFIRWPGKSTASEGLAKFLTAGATAWPASPWGQEGVDFGVPADLTLIPGNQHPAWLDPNRIALKADTTKVVDGYLVQGYIDVNNQVLEAAYIRNCLIDGGYAVLYCVSQNSVAPLHVDRCTLRNFNAQAMTHNNGTISNCLIELSKGDGMKGDFFNGGVIYGNLIRKIGQIDPTTHADTIQCQNSKGLSIFGNTFYMPGTGTLYDEGTYGSTQGLRVVTENNTSSHIDFIAAGNLFIGGGYTIAVRSRFNNGETSKVENVIISNNVLGSPTYHIYGHISDEHGKIKSIGTIRNLLFHNNFDETGQPMSYGGINQNGLWHYDKAHASQRFLELGKRWGYLDWNGDPKPGIANRTEVNQAAGTIP